MFILWDHVSDIFYKDRECCLHILPKLLNEHIKLTHYSKINVRPAAKVLSSVSKVLWAYCPPEQKEVAIMDIRNTQSHEFEQIPMLTTSRSANHRRFSWLHNVFLKFFPRLVELVQQHQGNLTKDAGQKMFILWQRYEGLKISVNSTIEATQFLL